MSTPYERLLAELVPDGTFGGRRPPAPPPPRPSRPPKTSEEEAARHAADLAAELATYAVGQPLKRPQPRRHLRAVPPAA